MKRVMTGGGILVLTMVLGGGAGAALWILAALVSGPARGLSSTLDVAGLVVMILGWGMLAWWYWKRGKRRGVTLVSAILLSPAMIAGFLTAAAQGSTIVPRHNQGAVVLQTGKVLLVGGDDGRGFPDTEPTVLSTAMLFDPATKTWSITRRLPVPRERVAAVLLHNGDVLVAGGSAVPYPGNPSAASYLYHPTTGTWHVTGQMHRARERRSDIGIDLRGIVLSDGKVLVLGGVAGRLPGAASAEVFDPVSGRWSPTTSIPCHHARSFEVTGAMLLPSGNVLVFCDAYEGTVYPEEYDQRTGIWRLLHARRMARYKYTATLLSNGTVLLAGGSSDPYGNHPISTAEIYYPASDSWSETGDLPTSSTGQSAVRLGNGDVLVTGGYAVARTGPSSQTTTAVTSSELYRPAARTWSATGSARDAVAIPPLLVLHDGRALNIGGSSPEIYDPRSGTWSTLPDAAINW